ncbi:hypothetical protein TIFTF001_032754 [Ficus carica]|uniref:Uncharacterized protein n=1 Tax=Ficus carica TaxID=3494 RepID=A0AA88DWX9_FICCA|nr:hypothetical protein TIFTF001_032754 [Ficus carica]
MPPPSPAPPPPPPLPPFAVSAFLGSISNAKLPFSEFAINFWVYLFCCGFDGCENDDFGI